MCSSNVNTTGTPRNIVVSVLYQQCVILGFAFDRTQLILPMVGLNVEQSWGTRNPFVPNTKIINKNSRSRRKRLTYFCWRFSRRMVGRNTFFAITSPKDIHIFTSPSPAIHGNQFDTKRVIFEYIYCKRHSQMTQYRVTLLRLGQPVSFSCFISVGRVKSCQGLHLHPYGWR